MEIFVNTFESKILWKSFSSRLIYHIWWIISCFIKIYGINGIFLLHFRVRKVYLFRVDTTYFKKDWKHIKKCPFKKFFDKKTFYEEDIIVWYD